MKLTGILFFEFLMILHLSIDAKETIDLKYSVKTELSSKEYPDHELF